MSKLFLIPALLVAFGGVELFAQAPGAHWSTTPTASDPPLRRENPGTADLANMYVFGGQDAVRMNDLWKFDGTTWTLMTADGAPGSPPARSQAGVTWNFIRNRLTVFGGNDASGVALGDTWEWDPVTNTWADVTPASGPSARKFVAITFDPATGGILLFGGLDAADTHLNDTWLFDGSTWTPLSPVGALPSTRRQHHLVTRLDYNDVLLFGGQDATLSGSAKWRVDTWRWDGAAWTEIVTANAPAGQVANDAAYDMIRKRVVLACGNGTGGSPTGLISEFDSRTNDWLTRPLDSGIYKVTRYFAAYIAATGKTYKVSGQALNAARPPQPTYEFQSDVIASFTSGSAGCASSAGVPALAVDDLPWLGESLAMNVSNTPAGASTVIAIGVLTTSIPLSVIGAPAGCVLTVDPMVVLSAPISGSTGLPSLSLLIPNDPVLVGAVLHNQAIVFDGGAISASNRGDALFGQL